MSRIASSFKVLRKLIAQSWPSAALALVYAWWEFSSLPSAQRTWASFVHSWGVTFFLIMWFVGQWFRTSKQISDSEQLASLQSGINKSLSLLQDLTDVATAESLDHPRQSTEESSSSSPPDEAPINRVISEISRSPKAALLILGSELERELRQLLWSSGWIQGVGKTTITRSVEHLVELGVVPNNLGSSVKAFLDVRNRLLHGYGVTDDEVLRAVDIGLTIFRAVLAIPREQNHVYHPGVELYKDPECNHVRDNIRGVILETTSPGGSSASHRIYPTTSSLFVKGQRVSWEWNMSIVVGESWYRDPDTGSAKYAWGQSAEFVGRNLNDL
jgi:hypothetical protein